MEAIGIMNRDFSYSMYSALVSALKRQGYRFQTVEEYITNPGKRVAILRHDIDVWAGSALPLAEIEQKAGVSASYYFRRNRLTYNIDVIKKIHKMGHEIGYHYEDLALCNGDMQKAKQSFVTHLSLFRKNFPIKTVCMHGSSSSPFDNRDIWSKMKFSDYNIIGEPYLSIDYSRVMYYTDTGQRWDGDKISLRDRVKTQKEYRGKSTIGLINSINQSSGSMLITTHPEYWTGNTLSGALVKIIFWARAHYKVLWRNKRVRALSRRRKNER